MDIRCRYQRGPLLKTLKWFSVVSVIGLSLVCQALEGALVALLALIGPDKAINEVFS